MYTLYAILNYILDTVLSSVFYFLHDIRYTTYDILIYFTLNNPISKDKKFKLNI